MLRHRFAFLLLLLAAGGPGPVHATPACDHVMVIVMENHPYDTMVALPFVTSLAAQGALFTESYGITHPSEPNYHTLWSAALQAETSDGCPAAGSPYFGENLGHACEVAGRRWRAYLENLPGPGDPVCNADGSLYARRHAPWTDFGNVTQANARPFGDLANDIANDSLPALAFVIPNNCDNMHDCSPATGQSWLAGHVPGWLQALGPRGLLILTWDEDDYAGTNHICTVFAGGVVQPASVCTRTITHYTVVRTVCEALGLAPFANAATDSSITGIWADTTTTLHVPPAAATVALGPVHPNPSRDAASARLTLSLPRFVQAAVVDLAGRRVRTLASGTYTGTLALAWDGRDEAGRAVAPGAYRLAVTAGSERFSRLLVRLR